MQNQITYGSHRSQNHIQMPGKKKKSKKKKETKRLFR